MKQWKATRSQSAHPKWPITEAEQHVGTMKPHELFPPLMKHKQSNKSPQILISRGFSSAWYSNTHEVLGYQKKKRLVSD